MIRPKTWTGPTNPEIQIVNKYLKGHIHNQKNANGNQSDFIPTRLAKYAKPYKYQVCQAV